MPALVNSSVGSSPGTSGELGTARWPFCSKYFRKDARISFAVMRSFYKRTAPRLPRLALGAERLHHQIRLEPLADQIAEQPLELAVVGDRLAPVQPLAQRSVEQRVAVERIEHVLQRLLGRVLV